MSLISSVNSSKLDSFQTIPVKPKIDGRIQEILQTNLSKGIAFPRKNFTSADRSYLYLTGGYFYDQGEKQTPELATARKGRDKFMDSGLYVGPDGFPTTTAPKTVQFQTPEFSAYQLFTHIREICKNPNRDPDFRTLDKIIDRFYRITEKDLYPVLYWAYKQAKHANAPPALLEYLTTNAAIEKYLGLRTEFLSADELAAMESDIQDIYKAKFFQGNFGCCSYDHSSYHSPSFDVVTILEAAWENRLDALTCQLDHLQKKDPQLAKEVASAALTLVQSHKNREKMGAVENLLNQKMKTIEQPPQRVDQQLQIPSWDWIDKTIICSVPIFTSLGIYSWATGKPAPFTLASFAIAGISTPIAALLIFKKMMDRAIVANCNWALSLPRFTPDNYIGKMQPAFSSYK